MMVAIEAGRADERRISCDDRGMRRQLNGDPDGLARAVSNEAFGAKRSGLPPFESLLGEGVREELRSRSSAWCGRTLCPAIHPGRSHHGMRRHMPATLTLAIGLQMGEDDEEEEEVVVRGRQLCGWICCHGVVWPSTASAKPGIIEKKIRSRPWRKKVIRIHLPENT